MGTGYLAIDIWHRLVYYEGGLDSLFDTRIIPKITQLVEFKCMPGTI
jgi:hypothetical protein